MKFELVFVLGVAMVACGGPSSRPSSTRHHALALDAPPTETNATKALAGERARLFVGRFLLDLESESPKVLAKLETNAEFRTENSERRGRLAYSLDRSFKKDEQNKNRRLRFDLERLHAVHRNAGEPPEYFEGVPILAFSAPYGIETSTGSARPGVLVVGVIDRGDRISVAYLENERGELE